MNPRVKNVTPTNPYSLKVPEGKRAVTVVVDRMSAAGGMVKSGDYVDVFCNLSLSEKGKTHNVTVPLFQKVLVLNSHHHNLSN